MARRNMSPGRLLTRSQIQYRHADPTSRDDGSKDSHSRTRSKDKHTRDGSRNNPVPLPANAVVGSDDMSAEGVLVTTLTAVARVVMPIVVPMVVPTALMHQNGPNSHGRDSLGQGACACANPPFV